MKYCQKCGNKLKDDDMACPKCGTSSIEQNTTNNFAIAGFVCSFLVPILGLIFSAIGLNKTKTITKGKGLAVAGLTISIITLAIGLIVAILFIILVITELVYQ